MIGDRAMAFRNLASLELLASRIRNQVGVGSEEHPDMLRLFETLQDYRFGHLAVSWDILPRADIGHVNARTVWIPKKDTLLVILSEESYTALYKKSPQEDARDARLDVAHELGHLVLHEREIVSRGITGQGVGFARDPCGMSAEWQAEKFGLAFLAPKYLVREDDLAHTPQLARRFGLTASAASSRTSDIFKMRGGGR